MSKHIIHSEKDAFYFCTVTCYDWINLFEITNFYGEIYNWFDILFRNYCFISGYVLMPNHFHTLIYQSIKSPILNKSFSNGKRFMSYGIVSILEQLGEVSLLKVLNYTVPENEKKKGKKHQVFMPSFDARLCHSEEMLVQKLDYMHYNPVSGKWNLVTDYTDYPHSSARWYDAGIPIKSGWFRDYREIIGL